MVERKPWECRHGVHLNDVSIGRCDDCVLSPDPTPEQVIAGLAAMLAGHLHSLFTTLEAAQWSDMTDPAGCFLPREKINELIDGAFAAVMVASSNAAAMDAPSCPVEFAVARAGRISGGERNDDQVMYDIKRNIAQAWDTARAWHEDVRAWAYERSGRNV